ncbi:hypothetical protein BCR36DRAFT_360958 [Piromyces finnis]|uniref:Cyclin N-terminal domain-containing protein n=1 Tax=Piromyces finnis TaxID=1754191 RepID=A0A1Y1UYR8_9FUNG|nr:hypothetical protein BCR36DRAFT_360958 [Piromyces finnis]|eukprot:ORX43517.1 hypothetical protein BCR36DRAFT_360958 [Piromyces finnis]
MGLFSFFNQNNSTANQHGESNLTQTLQNNKDKIITYENLRCSNIPKELRNLFFDFFTKFIQESTSKTSSVSTHISLHNFVEILIHRYDLPFFIPIVSFIYINRLLKIPNVQKVLSEFTPNRLTAVAIIVASKYYLEDTIYIKNSKWISKVCMGLFKTGELNALESLFLRSLDYHINVSYAEWEDYLDQIDRGLQELRLKHNYSNDCEMENEKNTISTSIQATTTSKPSSSSAISNENHQLKNVKQLFNFIDCYILDNNQLKCYDPSLEPNFSVLYNVLETFSKSISSSPPPQQQQQPFVDNNEIEKMKQNSSSQDINVQTTTTSTHHEEEGEDVSSSNYNDKIMDEDKPVMEEDNTISGSRVEKQNYQYTGILTPPSSSSSTSSQSVTSTTRHHGSSNTTSRSDSCCNIDLMDDGSNEEKSTFNDRSYSVTSSSDMEGLTSSTTTTSQNIISYHNKSSFTPTQALPLSSLNPHYPSDIKNLQGNYSVTGRLTATHNNHYNGQRYHPFSKPKSRNATPEVKRNGLPLFSPIKMLDKPVTAVSPYVSSLLNKHSMTKNSYLSDSGGEAQYFVSPIPNSFSNGEGRRSNAIKSFRILDDDEREDVSQAPLKKKPDQISVEDIAAKFSIIKSKNTREHTKERLYKSNNRHSLPYSSRNRKHRQSLIRTSPSSPSSGTNTTITMTNHHAPIPTSTSTTSTTTDTNLINFGLGISKKSKLISKNSKLNIPKAKNQKLITSYLNTMMEPVVMETSTPTTTTTTSTPFLKRFPSITKWIHRFNIKKEKKAVS